MIRKPRKDWVRQCCNCKRLFRVPQMRIGLRNEHVCQCGYYTIYSFRGLETPKP